ncbi:MAG: hypothetical protein WAV07_12165 [Candidatus Contendobacter sp.]
MSTAVGIDLNGVLDCVAGLDAKPRYASAPPVIVADTPQGMLTGAEALLSPFGRPGLAATVGARFGVFALLRALVGTDTDAPHLLGQHLHSLLPGDNRACVIAVPDTPAFDERARDRLLGGALRAGVNASLLWRPVAALLGWEETQSAADIRALHGQRACVLQLLPEGIAVSELDLECVEHAQPTLVPVRRRDGLRKMYAYSKGELPELLAAEAGVTDSRLIWASAWAWSALLGRPAATELLPDARSPSGWRMVEGFSTLQGELALAISATVDRALNEDRAVLQKASVILIEGPLANASIKPRLGKATRLLDLLRIKLIEFTTSSHLITVPTMEGLVAKGCASCAERQSKGQITYYDFLPMLEINVLRGAEHAFVPLIDKNDRVEGGKTYSNKLADQFVIAEGTSSLVFYLLKEDERTARRSETKLPVPPGSKIEISLHVTQTPAQGYAQVEIRPEVRGALGNTPILLDWAKMTEVDWSQERILFELSIQGIGYPDILPQKGHRLIWEKTTILDTIKQFNACSTRERRYDSMIRNQHAGTLGSIGIRSSPFILTKGIDQDQHIYTAVGSDGHLPEEVSEEVIEAFNVFREKLGNDFAISNGIIGSRRRIEQLARLGATLYAGCPEAIIGYYRRVISSAHVSQKLVMYTGKVLSKEQDLINLYKYCKRRYDNAYQDRKPLSWFVIRAAGDALAYRECAGEILDPTLADALADAMLYVLKREVDKYKSSNLFKVVVRSNSFKVVVRLSAFLLRHRMHPEHRDFLHVKSLNTRNSQRAKELLRLLKIASDSGALSAELRKNIDQIQEHILYQGTNSIIDISVDDDDTDNETDDLDNG